MTKHTPLPWHLAHFAPVDAPDSFARLIVVHSDVRIAEIRTNEDDGKFITTACNCHEALLEACQYMLEELGDGQDDDTPGMAKARAAIARVEGGAA